MKVSASNRGLCRAVRGAWSEGPACVLNLLRNFSPAPGFACPSKGHTLLGAREAVFKRTLNFYIFTYFCDLSYSTGEAYT